MRRSAKELRFWRKSAARNSACRRAAPMSSARSRPEHGNPARNSGDLERRRSRPRGGIREWFQGEHLIERLARSRLSVRAAPPGDLGRSALFQFLSGRVARVLTSKPYLERLDNPTPMTKKIMSGVFINMSRTVCHRTAAARRFRGAYAVTVRFNETPDEAALAALLEKLVADDPASPAAKSGSATRSGRPAGVDGRKIARRRQEDQSLPDGRHIAPGRCRGDSARAWRRNFRRAEVGVFRVLCQIGRGDL